MSTRQPRPAHGYQLPESFNKHHYEHDDLAKAGHTHTGICDAGVKVGRLVTDQAVSHNTWTTVSYDTELWDTDGFWSSGTDIDIPTGFDGRYEINVWVRIEVNTTGTRRAEIRINGTTLAAVSPPTTPTTGATDLSLSLGENLQANDTITVRVYQDSGVELDIQECRVSVQCVGSYYEAPA